MSRQEVKMNDRWYFPVIFIPLILVFPSGVCAATLSGKVLDSRGDPVNNAVVSVGGKFEFTDVNGRYRIKEVSAGAQKVQVKRGERILKEETIEIMEPGVKKDLTVP